MIRTKHQPNSGLMYEKSYDFTEDINTEYDNLDIIKLTASDSDLQHILENFTNIIKPSKNVSEFTWFGDTAKTIYHNL